MAEEIAASIVACGEEVRKLKAAGDAGAGAKVFGRRNRLGVPATSRFSLGGRYKSCWH
jgi:hypothetical protein